MHQHESGLQNLEEYTILGVQFPALLSVSNAIVALTLYISRRLLKNASIQNFGKFGGKKTRK